MKTADRIPPNTALHSPTALPTCFSVILVTRVRSPTRLNGVPMVDFSDPKPTSFDGKIALQLHAGGHGNMEFTDIWIRDLSAPLANSR